MTSDGRSILILSHEYPPIGGGGSGAIRDLAHKLAERGAQVVVVTARIEGHTRSQSEQHNLELLEVSCFRHSLLNASAGELVSFLFFSLLPTYRAIKRFRPGLVLANFGIPAGVDAALLSLLTRVPFICWLGGHDVPGLSGERFSWLVNSCFYRWLLAWAYRRASMVCPVSVGLGDALERSIPNLPLTYLYSGIPLYPVRPDVAVQDGAIPVIFHTARLETRKRQDILLRACAILRFRGIAYKLRIFGDGSLRPELEKLAGDLGISNDVVFHGFVDSDELRRSLPQGRMFVLCSVAEGMPRGVLEAMGAGLPVVMTDVEGAREMVSHGESGLIVPVADADALADAMASIIVDDVLCAKLLAGTRLKAEELGWGRSAEEVERMYDRFSSHVDASLGSQCTREVN